jgi:hypothetical protein
MGNAMGQGVGLPRACTRNDQQGGARLWKCFAAVLDRITLRVVQGGKPVHCGH